MISNLSLLFFALWKAGMLTGVLPGIAIAIFFGRFRIVAIGMEQVRGGQLVGVVEVPPQGRIASPPRKVRAA
jgi:hypothetical protein